MKFGDCVVNTCGGGVSTVSNSVTESEETPANVVWRARPSPSSDVPAPTSSKSVETSVSRRNSVDAKVSGNIHVDNAETNMCYAMAKYHQTAAGMSVRFACVAA